MLITCKEEVRVKQKNVKKMEGGGVLKIIIKKMNEICFRVFDIELRQFQKQISDD